MKKILTLCMVIKEKEILLGMKKRGFGVGKWNGFGGKIEENETIEEGAVRELKEEIGIGATEIEKVGIINFSVLDDPVSLEVHVFKVLKFIGEPIESEEMRPQWFSLEAIPFSEMWPDDIYWLPIVLNGKLFTGNFLFDKPIDSKYLDTIIKYDLTEVDTL